MSLILCLETSTKVCSVALGLNGKITVRDLWKKTDVGEFKKQYKQMVNAHGAVLLRLKVK